jgi:two-component system, NarL family, nitrate/nitrite response regulator NarL
MKPKKINVVVVEDNPVVREAIVKLLAGLHKTIRVIAEAANGEEFLSVAAVARADVYLVDIEMPVLGGIKATELLLRAAPGSKVVILSIYRDRVLVEKAFQAGARGYVLKENAAEDILRAIEAVHGGGVWASAPIERYLR